MKSTIRLFRAVPIDNHNTGEDLVMLKNTIKEGFIFAPEVFGTYSGVELGKIYDEVKAEIGFNAKQANNAFHKSWQKVRDASIEQLVLEQIVHYFTTYGFEALGVYSKDSVYIPTEKLSIPKINEDKIQLTVIHGYTKEELKTKLLDLLNSGIALHENTIKDVVDVALFVSLTGDEIQALKNKEVKATLYDFLGVVPQNPTEFLRYIVYKATDSALLIKNKTVIEKIKKHTNIDVLNLFYKYEQQYGLNHLAEIFYRFKPLFLAFKTNTALNKIINRIRKLAVKNHKPMPEDYLNTVTAKIHLGEKVDPEILNAELARVNIFRKIRLAYALKYRSAGADAILYKIRNGKGYATGFKSEFKETVDEVLAIVVDSITKQISENVNGKRIYIPENIGYALPTTEKQFTGMFPAGTYVIVPKDMVFGVHWEDVKEHRIDLDLSLISADAKYGWDSYYRSGDRSILFSGDMTSAPKPHGASELFYVKKQEPAALLMMVNYFNYDKEIEVPMQIFVAQQLVERMSQNYMVNPNNMVAVANSSINQKQKIVGLIITDEKECRFYFSESYVGNSISSSRSDTSENTRKYLKIFNTNMISLNDLLVKAGATIVTNKEEEFDIDLSPANLQKDSILNLVKLASKTTPQD